MAVSLVEIKEALKKSSVDLDVDALNENHSLQGQGVDSLVMMDIALSIEENMNVKISDGDIDGIKTLSDLLKYVNDKLPA